MAKDLALIWNKDYSEGEQALFLDFMQSCRICFRLGETRTGQTRYLAPDCLPKREDPEIQAELREKWEPEGAREGTVRFPFLHHGMLRSILWQIAQRTQGTPLYWKYGCYFLDERTGFKVLLDYLPGEKGAGELKVQWRGHSGTETGPLAFLKEILERVCGQSGVRPLTESAAFELIKSRPEAREGEPEVREVSGGNYDVEESKKKGMKVFISYSHKDKELKDDLLETLSTLERQK